MRAWILLAAVVMGCQDTPPSVTTLDVAIVDGEESERDPGVVALAWAGQPRCSGTVVAPRLVLTAAHCLRPDLPVVLVGATPGLAEQQVEVAGQIVHPAYGTLGSLRDVALLVLADPLATTPVRLATAGTTFVVDDSLRVVGFGHTGPGGAGELVRRSGTVQIASITEEAIYAAAAPSQVCYGDSGGAALWTSGAEELLLGVISDVGVGCEGEALLVRVDAIAADFVMPWIDATRDGGSVTGARCWIDEQCEGGSCLAASDAPDIRFCASTCAGDHACPGAMRCDDGVCRHPLPSPGARGSACGADGDCVDGPCLAVGEGGELVCSRRCLPAGDTCGEAEACVETVEGGDFGCARPSTQGCSSSGGGASPLVLGIAILAALVARMVHRRRARLDRTSRPPAA